jgi:multidrug efflux pump subunit AcrA (membrane-fusion protein)
MDICSPKDGFVVKLFVGDGDQVTKGSPLIQMDSDHEDRHLESLATADSIREIRAAQFQGDQLKLLRDMAQLNVDLACGKA